MSREGNILLNHRTWVTQKQGEQLAQITDRKKQEESVCPGQDLLVRGELEMLRLIFIH